MQSVKESLLAAFRHMMKPLVRVALKNGITYPEFSDCVKHTYVAVAAKKVVGPREANLEAIALIANLPPAEVARLIQLASEPSFGALAAESNPLPSVLAAWHTDGRSTGPYALVVDLPFETSNAHSNKDYTFTQLVNDYCPGHSARALLDELVRAKCVESVGHGFYRAVRRSYVSEDPLSVKNISMFAQVVHNLCEGAEVNLRPESADGKGLLQRSIWTDHGIPESQLPAFDKFIRSRGQMFADDIDNWLADWDKKGIADGVKTGVGIYHYIVNEDDERALARELLNQNEGL